ncbi:MAG: autotransporter domain-containing protein [Flavobacterium sp.]|uniref:autotransporter domain-containing protein n=1 Tax=Flavobacterium sp. TaxID=239 RepID=UPI00120AB687|nr:autotransporter domain-containing protein [Flavobacterium sp.]RZJ65961.1 MAG: autotransporter domain-containing protein [Flavobacterium sp.]
MKRSLLAIALFAFTANYAQTTTVTTTTTTDNGETKTASMTSVYDKAVTVSAIGSFPELNQVGLSIEFLGNNQTKTMKDKKFSYYSSKIVNITYGMMKYEVPGDDLDGNGFVVEIGQRTYFMGKNSGPYLGNYLSYGNIKFDEDFGGENFDGTYSYFSLFSPELGYKIKLGNLAIDPFAGIMWKLEIKGKGFVDNRNVDEWTPRVGLKIGYQF